MPIHKQQDLYWNGSPCILLLSLLFSPLLLAKTIEHFIYFPSRGVDGITIKQDLALLDPRFSGAQVVYTWRELEPVRGLYDFSSIRKDLSYLKTHNKQMWIQLQDKSFTPKLNVPDYLVKDPQYKGFCRIKDGRSVKVALPVFQAANKYNCSAGDNPSPAG